MSKTKSKQFSSSTSNQSSDPLSPQEVAGYFTNLNALSGGRLRSLATRGTAKVNFKGPTDSQIKRMGGLGATQKLDINRSQRQALDQINADPSYSVFQKQRGRQLTNQDALQATQALDKETEALIAQMAMDRATKTTETNFRNAEQKRQDLATIIEAYFGGKGQRSKGTSTNVSSGKTKGSILEDIGNVASFAVTV